MTKYAAVLAAILPTTTPTSIPEAASIVQNALPSVTELGSIINSSITLIENGFKPGDLSTDVIGSAEGVNSVNNVNPRNPDTVIYPKKSPSDAPYSLAESALRASIYIPPTFSYGNGSKQPVILVPGTGSYGGDTYTPNFIKTLTPTTFADPLWLNIPGALLDDAQVNSEYVAYAINYISAISSNKNVSVISWSQGGIDTQWALKYWPSTRNITSDFIAISPDFHGTVNAYFICPDFPRIPCDPSVIQQEYNSTFVATLRSNGGDSAYVPTTTVYTSNFDEIVQPQTGSLASAILGDSRGVGVTNNELQALCTGQVGGSFYDHAAVLQSSLAYALAVDALTHPGPGMANRLDLTSVCGQYAAPGLGLEDTIATYSLIPRAGMNLLLYEPKVLEEPAIMAYAV
ncbi:MAG: hypothetical protein Q9227_001110 [Pyrenula ochraceoflavens]